MEATIVRRAILVGAVAAGVALGSQLEFSGDPTCKTVDLDNRRHARILDHAHDAIDRGLPERLTIKRDEAARNRRLSLRGIPTRAGFDRDEYPPAAADEGGAGASVRYVRSSENRAAGARLGRELRGLSEGACFRYERRPRR
jgi:hypothetical protein